MFMLKRQTIKNELSKYNLNISVYLLNSFDFATIAD